MLLQAKRIDVKYLCKSCGNFYNTLSAIRKHTSIQHESKSVIPNTRCVYTHTTEKEVQTMDNKNQMQIGTWDRIGTEDSIDRVKFDVNITQRVVFLTGAPKERTGEDGGVYYVFEIEQDGKPKVINTSSWTLLREIKRLNIAPGSIVDITKKIDKGKQFFVASMVNK